MNKLSKYLKENAKQVVRAEADADVIFFGVNATPEADADTLTDLIKQHQGEFNSVDLFDGIEHSYIEIGGWIGDQKAALTLIGLGSALGLWKLMTPLTMLPLGSINQATAKKIAESGMVSLKVKQ